MQELELPICAPVNVLAFASGASPYRALLTLRTGARMPTNTVIGMKSLATRLCGKAL